MAVGEAMTDEQKSKNHKQFLRLCAEYIEHRFYDWKDARGYYVEKEHPFWIDLWDPELLRKCEVENQDDHPRAVLKWQWELHVKNMKQAKWEEEQALEEARKKDIICLDDTSDEESMKEKPKAVICLLDDSDDEKDKENVCNRKRFKIFICICIIS
jgi:predicted transcriptional regulator